jgi:hypothetical protein
MYPAPKVRHYQLELADDGTTLLLTDFGDQVNFGVSFTVQNIDTSANVFIGGTDVGIGEYGIKLAPGAIASFEDMPRYPGLYAITDTDGSEVAILRVSK